MKRVKPQEVIDAYKSKAVKASTCNIAIQGSTESCCGLGILLAQVGVTNPDKMSYEQIADRLGLASHLYVDGFICAFDCGNRAREKGDEIYNMGVEDGRAVRAAVTQEGLWANPERETYFDRDR